MKFLACLFLGIVFCFSGFSQEANWNCTNNPARAWWDVQHYDIKVSIDTLTGYISGTIAITAKVIKEPLDSFQIDLQYPMQLKSVLWEIKTNHKEEIVPTDFKRHGNAYFLKFPFRKEFPIGEEFTVLLQFEGIPKIAKSPPWDGGLVFTKDSFGNPWLAMACQGIGASVWLPCKDIPEDEPDKGVDLYLTVPKNLSAIGNGKLIEKQLDKEKATWHWQVKNPINNYNISFYIGNYTHWADTFQGMRGHLDLDFYVLPKDLEKAQKQFRQVKEMLSCFEAKFGIYPFYEDGYKLVQAPYLGMEHQSAIAYGNRFENGYLGTDRSETGYGLLFDFILIHESAHEWFGNSITAKDIADQWIQEGLTSYAETIFLECIRDRKSAFLYQQGKKNTILNDRPVQGDYGACDEGSSDHYDKAGFMFHSIRVLLNDDSLFFEMLQGINETFYHKIISGAEIESFILNFGLNKKIINQAFFNQYLKKAELPILEFRENKYKKWEYRWTNCVPGFQMPVQFLEGEKQEWILPVTIAYKVISSDFKNFEPENINTKDFLFTIKVLVN